MVKHVSTCFFAADATCAVHDDVFVFLIFQHICCHRQLFSESIAWNFDGFFKMAHFVFVMIAHVYHNRIFIGSKFIELLGVYVLTAVGHIK